MKSFFLVRKIKKKTSINGKIAITDLKFRKPHTNSEDLVKKKQILIQHFS